MGGRRAHPSLCPGTWCSGCISVAKKFTIRLNVGRLWCDRSSSGFLPQYDLSSISFFLSPLRHALRCFVRRNSRQLRTFIERTPAGRADIFLAICSVARAACCCANRTSYHLSQFIHIVHTPVGPAMQKPPSRPKSIEHRLRFRVVILQLSPHNVGIDVIFPILLERGLLTRPVGHVHVDRTGHAKVPRPRSVFGTEIRQEETTKQKFDRKRANASK
mmetsp:Transcript_38319/g.74952  ORF Transcript_38319/g.74952 Transcript_38319/m.74952 type:complete len:217 (+) Transcript_38319:804-1454(+)